MGIWSEWSHFEHSSFLNFSGSKHSFIHIPADVKFLSGNIVLPF